MINNCYIIEYFFLIFTVIRDLIKFVLLLFQVHYKFVMSAPPIAFYYIINKIKNIVYEFKFTCEAMYIAAAATEIGDLPGTISISTAFFAMCVAARCTIFGRSGK